ncbi:MAG: CsbD family protein [Rubrivivax sp.]|nr:CsbD family protein [Rubrivivax sp.]MDP3225292.1 CsbD family protein [Rubrivivax sp.]MDP3615021.1 CsbD family protein [Rubrivivax sp.]
MNKDQVQGTLKDAAGKLQETAGWVLRNNRLQRQGVRTQVHGQAQRAVGDIKAIVKNVSKA